MRISDWSSDVCSSDLAGVAGQGGQPFEGVEHLRRRTLEQAAATETEQRVAAKQEPVAVECDVAHGMAGDGDGFEGPVADPDPVAVAHPLTGHVDPVVDRRDRSEEHTSELQSLMRISYAVFCLKKKTKKKSQTQTE